MHFTRSFIFSFPNYSLNQTDASYLFNLGRINLQACKKSTYVSFSDFIITNEYKSTKYINRFIKMHYSR
jgi:hypothetical protein